jgi:hypothetical protein
MRLLQIRMYAADDLVPDHAKKELSKFLQQLLHLDLINKKIFFL